MSETRNDALEEACEALRSVQRNTHAAGGVEVEAVTVDEAIDAIRALKSTPAPPSEPAQVCTACGKPWDGEKCGQQYNGWPYPVCEPVAASSYADAYIDQLNTLCEKHGCVAGSDRLAWLDERLNAQSRGSYGDYWHSIDTAPEDEHVILATTGGHVGEALMLIDENTGKQKWTWAGGPVSQFHKPLGWRPMPSPISAEVPRDDRPGGFDGPTGAD